MRRSNLVKRTLAVTMLNYLHKFYTYKELSKKLSIPQSMISRYIRGHNLPSEYHADAIIDFFMKSSIVRDYLGKLLSRGAIDEIVSDNDLLEILAFISLEKARKIDPVFDYIVIINDISSFIGLRIASQLRAKVIVGFIPPLVPPGADLCITIGQYINSLTICLKARNIGKLRRSSALFVHPLTLPLEYSIHVKSKLMDFFGNIRILAPLCNSNLDDEKIICGFITES
ncbi:hypothetical protein Pyrde_1044 [Pyrodictium delaneyi]|uniref:HTH cro/C1-type domain-containing protein n=1 Tax=Pyrodictium delaneyi TaxID=1273541 RepID=A0A0P0N436_9CREN|nr:hypothetical protein Pyrde_1044 [Pyrodictium delaneyi]